MLIFLLGTFIFALVTATSQSSSYEITAEKHRITKEDTGIYVRASANIAQGTTEEGIGGHYTALVSPKTSSELVFFEKMRQECASRWTLMGQWKRNQGGYRYLLVFNSKSQGTAPRQRWIIASFTNRGTGRGDSDIEPDIILDTGKPRKADSYIKFSISKPTVQSHASGSARESAPVERMDTQQHPDIGRRALKEAQDELQAQTQKMIAIAAHRDRLDDTLKRNQHLWDQTQSELLAKVDSANSEIEKLNHRITAKDKSLVEVKRGGNHHQKCRREQLTGIEELKRDNKQLREQHQRKQIQQQEYYEAEIQKYQEQLLQAQKELHDELLHITQERDSAKRELEVSRLQNVQLESRLLEMESKEPDDSVPSSNDDKPRNSASNNDSPSLQWKSPILWCCISAVIVMLVVILSFCIYHRRRLRKKQEETTRLHRIISINKNNRNRDVTIDIAPKLIEGKEDQEPNTPPRVERNVTNPKRGERESFNDLVQNMDEVQGVVMDDIMDQMVTEGAEENEYDQKNLQSDDAAEGYVVTGAPTK